MKKTLFILLNFILFLPLLPVYGASEANISQAVAQVCPLPEPVPPKVSVADQPEKKEGQFEDESRELRDLGTDLVVKKFFTTQDTLYNFMKFVYQTIENSLALYKSEHNLSDRAIFILFKGGNVLRMISHAAFDLLSPDARKILEDNYSQYFQRSDADFSVYIDEKKLNDQNYDVVIDDISTLLLQKLDDIRAEFENNPQQYFNFMQLKNSFASQVLKKYLDDANNIDALKNKDNSHWFGASFTQLQLLDRAAEQNTMCPYQAQYDFKYEIKDNKIVTTRVSETPHWIVNSENRNLAWQLGSDPNEIVKFYLVRSKVGFDYSYIKDNKLKSSIIGGELIDVSVVHRDDSHLRKFLDNYDKTVSEYTLKKNNEGEQFNLKSYSLLNLDEDLQFIIFDSFERPWDGGRKYNKRVNRIFFIHIMELLSSYGEGSKEGMEFLDYVEKNMLAPAAKLFPLNSNSAEVVSLIKSNAETMAQKWKELTLASEFWMAFANLIERMVNQHRDGDQEGLVDGTEPKALIKAIQENLDIAKTLENLPTRIMTPGKGYEFEMRDLF